MVVVPLPLNPRLAFVATIHFARRWAERCGAGADPLAVARRATFLPGRPQIVRGDVAFDSGGWDDVYLFDDATEMVLVGKWDGCETVSLTTCWCARKFRG